MEQRWLNGLLHLAFWSLTSWAITAGFSIESQEIEILNGQETVRIVRNFTLMWQLLVAVGLSIALFYANAWCIQRLQARSSRRQVVAASVALFLGAVLLHRSLLYFGILPDRPQLPGILFWTIFLFYYVASITFAVGRLWWRAERQRQRLELEKTEARLQLLRSQLHPHFLFNVLNNLLSLVDQQANPKLAGAIDQLSQLLRYVVYESNGAGVPMEREIDFIRHYADLQLLRFEEGEVRFSLTIEGSPEGLRLEPGLLLPFVENAFKYGAEPEQQSDIRIHFDFSRKDRWQFQITNPIHPDLAADRRSGGLGLPAVMERLHLLYPDQYRLEIRPGPSVFKIELEIHRP